MPYDIFLYAGDEIEVSSSSLTYETVKTLRCLSIPRVIRPNSLIIVTTLRTNNQKIPASMAIYIDNEFRLETSSDKDRDEIIVNEFSCGDWVRPRVHSIELKLKTAQVGGIAYNNFFEVYYSEKGGKDHAEHQS